MLLHCPVYLRIRRFYFFFQKGFAYIYFIILPCANDKEKKSSLRKSKEPDNGAG